MDYGDFVEPGNKVNIDRLERLQARSLLCIIQCGIIGTKKEL